MTELQRIENIVKLVAKQPKLSTRTFAFTALYSLLKFLLVIFSTLLTDRSCIGIGSVNRRCKVKRYIRTIQVGL